MIVIEFISQTTITKPCNLGCGSSSYLAIYSQIEIDHRDRDSVVLSGYPLGKRHNTKQESLSPSQVEDLNLSALNLEKIKPIFTRPLIFSETVLNT
jgi:hypothetical protein